MPREVKDFKGSQGSWEAEVIYTDGSREILPCVHKHYFKADADGNRYDDPWSPEIRRTTKYAKHIELMRSKHRVILTDDDYDASKGRGQGCFKRKSKSKGGYIFVSDIDDLVVDDAGMRFRFVGNPVRLRR